MLSSPPSPLALAALALVLTACASAPPTPPASPADADADAASRASTPAEPIVEPRRIAGPTPVWPKAVVERSVRGVLVVKCRITTLGEPKDCKVTRTFPGAGELESIALQMVQGSRFAPARRRGQPVEVDTPTAFVFK